MVSKFEEKVRKCQNSRLPSFGSRSKMVLKDIYLSLCALSNNTENVHFSALQKNL